MKWAIILLIFLISCAPATQEVITKPIVEQQPVQPKTEQVLEPEIKAPVAEPTPAKEPEPQPKLSPGEACAQDCEIKCHQTAQNSCTQAQRAQCREMCNDNPIIDPSACTQACSYLSQPNVCKQQMEQFCSAQCVAYCH